MNIANLCGLFAIATLLAGAWIVGSDLLFHLPEIFETARTHIAGTIFWLCAFGFAASFAVGIRT